MRYALTAYFEEDEVQELPFASSLERAEELAEQALEDLDAQSVDVTVAGFTVMRVLRLSY